MYRQVNTRLWWNKNRAGRRQSAGRCCYIWTDIYRRGGARGHILGFVLQNFPCKPDQRSVKEDKGERRRWMPTSCHTLWFVPLPCFIANPSIWLGTQSPCSSFLDHHLPPVCPPSIGALGEVWVFGGNTGHGLWVGAACLYPTDYSTSLHHRRRRRPPPAVGGANLPWKRLRARSRHEALIRHSPEWVLRTINL